MQSVGKTSDSRKFFDTFLVDIGYGNAVQKPAVMAVLDFISTPVRRFVAHKDSRGEVVDATKGKMTKTVLVMMNGYLVLSGLTPREVRLAIVGSDP